MTPFVLAVQRRDDDHGHESGCWRGCFSPEMNIALVPLHQERSTPGSATATTPPGRLRILSHGAQRARQPRRFDCCSAPAFV